MKNITETDYMGHQLENQIMFRAVCGCVDPYHDQQLTIELLDFGDKQGMLELSIDHKMTYPDWKENNWFKKIWKRIKLSFKLLFTGIVELEGGFAFSGEDAILDYTKAIHSGMKKLKQMKKRELSGEENVR